MGAFFSCRQAFPNPPSSISWHLTVVVVLVAVVVWGTALPRILPARAAAGRAGIGDTSTKTPSKAGWLILLTASDERAGDPPALGGGADGETWRGRGAGEGQQPAVGRRTTCVGTCPQGLLSSGRERRDAGDVTHSSRPLERHWMQENPCPELEEAGRGIAHVHHSLPPPPRGGGGGAAHGQKLARTPAAKVVRERSPGAGAQRPSPRGSLILADQ